MLSLPGAEQAAHVDQLGDVVGVVIGKQQGLTQNRLAVTPRDAGVQLSLGIRHQGLHGLHIFSELPDAAGPGRSAWRRFSLRPVSLGPFGRGVLGAAAELENVKLREAKMLEQHPRRVRESSRLGAAQVFGHVFDRIVESGMSAAAVEKIEQMLAKLFAVRIFDCHFVLLSYLSRNNWLFSDTA
jgi:hypothetical protein